MSSFNGLYIVRTGLFAARRAMEVVGQNVANANTAGYSRQEVAFASLQPGHVIHSAGRGVNDGRALRYRDQFLDRQYRSRAGAQGYHQARSTGLAQVEQILGDLSEIGLRSALDEFWGSWDNLALHPESPAARAQVIAAAEAFLSTARSTYDQLSALRSSLDEQIRHKITDINAAAQELSELNRKIAAVPKGEQPPNDLLDRRDILLDSLAKLAGATAVAHEDGTVTAHLGSLPLVDRFVVHPINVSEVQETTQPGQFIADLSWDGTISPVRFPGGEVAGLLELRDNAVPAYMQYLDNLVRTLATEVNNLHTQGVPAADQVNFFNITATDWMAIEVNDAIKNDPGLILAAGTYPGAPGDGERARQLAALRDASILTGDPVGTRQVTPGEYLRAIYTEAGMQVQQAQRFHEAADLQVAQADQFRRSVSGVSQDDEMSKMIQYQQAYNAAARVMTSMDEMLDVIVNRLGVAGR